MKRDERLTPKQQHAMEQVAGNMALSGIVLTERMYENVVAMITGQKTMDDVVAEITGRQKDDRGGRDHEED